MEDGEHLEETDSLRQDSGISAGTQFLYSDQSSSINCFQPKFQSKVQLLVAV